MAREGAEGHSEPGVSSGGTVAPEPAGASPRRLGDDDALHPVRRLRHVLGGAPAMPPRGWLPPAPRAEGGGDAATDAAGASVDAGAAGDGARADVRQVPARWGARTNLIAVLGLAAAAAGASTAVALLGRPLPPAAPTLLGIPALGPADGVGGLRMFSAGTGWAQRLSDGDVLHTIHGVTHWVVASPPTDARVLAVAEVDAWTAHALTVPIGAGSATSVQAWVTRNGGDAWSAEGTISVVGYNPSVPGTLSFTDAQHGWFSFQEAASGLAGTVLYRTVDGGAGWTEVAATGRGAGTGPAPAGVIPAGCDALVASFVSATTGWITGTCNAGPPPLYISRDGGATWAAETLSPVPGTSDDETSLAPAFTSAGAGTLLTESAEPTGVSTSLFATTDGGLSWRLRSTRAGAPLAVDFLDPGHGWLVTDGVASGGAPVLYATGDGGSDWTLLNGFPYVGLSLDFVTPELGWAAADMGRLDGGPRYLVQTDDGGRTWTTILPHLSGPSASP